MSQSSLHAISLWRPPPAQSNRQPRLNVRSGLDDLSPFSRQSQNVGAFMLPILQIKKHPREAK